MARPAEPEKKLEIAREAVTILQREGVDLSMAALADALSLKRPTLLYHFPTKADLVQLALIDLLTEQHAFVTEKVAKHMHPIDRLYAHLRAVHAFHAGNEARVVFLTQAIAATAGSQLPQIIAAGNAVFEAHRDDTVARLREGIREGTVGPCNPEALFACVRALVDGLMVQRVVTHAPLHASHEFIWEHVLRPLKTA
jgi:AcrR family transcriptional regulator